MSTSPRAALARLRRRGSMRCKRAPLPHRGVETMTKNDRPKMPPLPQQQQDDFDGGVKNRRAVLGDAWVDKSLDNASEFNAEFQSLITRYAWHDIWGRPGLDHTTRRLLVLGMTMGLARWEEFELHCRAAIRA